jgi:cellulose biosynthesis protein BcsQ
MTALIALFNHKGGVSKTTTTFNLGWALAVQGKRVLIVDADPQCNLTGTALGLNDEDDFEAFYTNNLQSNIVAGLSPVFQGAQTPLVPVPVAPTRQPNLFLLAGHIDLSLYETQLAIAVSTGAAIPALRNLPGAVCRFLRLLGDHHDFDAVLIDMSPSVGALNECLLIGSDFFIVPTSPDFYCDQAIRSLATVLPRWNAQVAGFRAPTLATPFPTNPPVCLGIISQRYRPREGNPAASFQRWIDRIKATMNTTLVPALSPLNMVVPLATFRAASPADTPYNLANIADFNTLIAQSQIHNVPVFALTDAQIERVGVVLANMITNRENFRTTFNNLAQCVIRLTGI